MVFQVPSFQFSVFKYTDPLDRFSDLEYRIII